MKIILLAGCSSGFGLETARVFLERGWKVIATMRNPHADILPASAHLRVLPLDVTDTGSIRGLIEAAEPLDALVNNAGIGLMSVLEGTTMQTMRNLFETNTFGTIAMTQAVVPQFRQRQDGVIVNVSSGTTLKPLPLLAAYTASKAAVNAFTESLALELEPFNVRVRLVILGAAPETAFSRKAVETTIGRYKTLIGPRLRVRSFAAQQTERWYPGLANDNPASAYQAAAA